MSVLCWIRSDWGWPTDPSVERVSVLAELPCLWICHHVLIREPRSPYCVATRFGLIFVPEHECSRFTPYAITADDYISLDLCAVHEFDARLVLVFPVLLHSLPQVDLNTNTFRVLKDDLVQLAAVAVEHGTFLIAWWVLLVQDNLAGVIFVDIEAV